MINDAGKLNFSNTHTICAMNNFDGHTGKTNGLHRGPGKPLQISLGIINP